MSRFTAEAMREWRLWILTAYAQVCAASHSYPLPLAGEGVGGGPYFDLVISRLESASVRCNCNRSIVFMSSGGSPALRRSMLSLAMTRIAMSRACEADGSGAEGGAPTGAISLSTGISSWTGVLGSAAFGFVAVVAGRGAAVFFGVAGLTSDAAGDVSGRTH